METEPDTDNVVYMDEYPQISERLRLRRMGAPAVRQVAGWDKLIIFERPQPPNDAA